MAARLLPLTLSELYAHALDLERICERRFSNYAARLRTMRAHTVALAFERMARTLRAELAAMQAASGVRKPAQLSPWEYAWRLAYMPDGVADQANDVGVAPANAHEALQLAVQARRRAGLFYEDVALNAADAEVRECAREMAHAKSVPLQRLEHLLAREVEAADRNRLPAAEQTPPTPLH